MSSSDISVALDSPRVSVFCDAFGARLIFESEGVQLQVLLGSLDVLERGLDDAMHDIANYRGQGELFTGKPRPDRVALHLAQTPGGAAQ